MDSKEPNIDTDKLSYEIFSILESKFLFGYDDQKLWIPKNPPSPVEETNVLSTSPSREIKNQRGKICILSIDGGGMRNILSGKSLAYLEQALKVKSGNQDARIADYFDVAVGSGFGGVFVNMLFSKMNENHSIFHGEDTWKLLAEQGKKIYSSKESRNTFLRRVFRGGGGGGGSNSSDVSSLTKVMKELFMDKKTGRFLTLKDTIKPVLIPVYDLSSASPFLFSRADAFESESFDFPLWEVCRATVAEPGLFEPVILNSVDGKTGCVAVDGGLAMVNPTAAAITHVLHNKQEFPFVRGVEDILVISLGAGQLLEGSFEYEQVKKWKAKDWAKPMARISGDGAADMVDHSVAMAFGQCRSSNYVRIQANGSSFGHCGVNIDADPSPSNVKKLLGIADEMLKQKNVESLLFGGKKIAEQSNLQKLDWFAGELVQEHQRRSSRIAPTVAFKQHLTNQEK
ncbi:Patatin-like protein 8 [Capsicum annuum]|uniref:patatin-like protein 6 n=1 Tax=Capsicum annuum TaxID=4072 RepID=UPI001FB0B60C|nr:patatin-like protein 6 [Capsicum annuum]XP_016573903.2 patatin-like protein 6 [Capsicum annuum]XP_016573904.2 patatin-like protein 6 [Capsicum annuum]XP_016573905.2 patatin-like protein 6 [Capsicum annuum]KAF3625674.1 Patatin-like protein 8 [Capsicum annuum]